MNSESRDLLARSLSWSDAHVSLDDAVRDLAPELRGVRPPGLAHSVWELVEHIRIAQRDILEFCLDGEYAHMEWPAGYWPPSAEPPSPDAWDQSIASLRADRAEFERLARDPAVDLSAVTPHGTDQTLLREIILAADHAAYHVGQIVLVRQLLGAWPAP